MRSFNHDKIMDEIVCPVCMALKVVVHEDQGLYVTKT